MELVPLLIDCEFRSSQQKDHLSRFHITDLHDEDRIDVLVATSLLEEGLDIPSCKLVVKFNDTLSSKQDVQCKGRARHRNSRYIHIIHKDDEERATLRLKQYKEFQAEIGSVNRGQKALDTLNTHSTPCSGGGGDEKEEDTVPDVFDAKSFPRGLFVESSGAFMAEKNAYNKLHEIYNRFDRDLHCNVPWESFAVSPFSKHNFEQTVHSGICGLWRVQQEDIQLLNRFNLSLQTTKRDQCRLRVRRVKESDDSMEGTFYVTNSGYEAALEQFRSDRRERHHRNGRSVHHRAESPPLPDVIGTVHIQYDDVSTVKVQWIVTDDDDDDEKVPDPFTGTISEDRNLMTFSMDSGSGMTVHRISNVPMLNEDPNSFACNC